MKRYLFLAAALLSLGAFLPSELFAGAWTVPKGHMYHEVYMKYWYNDYDFNKKWEKKKKEKSGWYDEYYIEYKNEFGLTDNLNLLFQFPYQEAVYKDSGTSLKNNGVKEVWFGAKYRFMINPVVMAAQVKAKYATDYDTGKSPGLGSKDNDIEARALIGKSFDPYLPAYLSLEGAYRWRGREAANDVPYFAEIGYYLYRGILLKTNLDGIWGQHGTGDVESYMKCGGAITFEILSDRASVYRISQSFNIELGYTHVLVGQSSGAGKEIVLKVSARI